MSIFYLHIYIYMPDTGDVYTLLNDSQYFEGFVGALGTMISFFVFRQIFDLNSNMGIVLGLTFISTWLIRKMGMSVYKNVKNNLGQPEKEWRINELYDLETLENPKRAYYIILGLFLLFIGIVSAMTARKVISPTNTIVFLLYCVGFISLIHFSK